MSFGWSGSDVFLLAQLAWNTVQNARKACGEYDELTRETVRLHAVLQRLAQEVAKEESPINRPGETSKEQLERIANDCEVVLKQLDQIVTAYASLGEEKRSARKIWQRVRFGNGQRADLGDLRSKLMSYTSEILLYLNLVSMSTVGRMEQRMNRDEGILRDIKVAVEKKTAHAVLGANQEGSVWTTYTSDDTGFWRGLRRDLVKDGLPSAAIHKHKRLIKKYVKELGARGILDESPSVENHRQQQNVCMNSEITEEVEDLPDNCNADLNTPRKHDRNVGVEPLEDVNEQCLSDPTNPALAKGIDVSFAVVSDVENDNDSSSKSTSSIVDSKGDLDLNDTFPSRNEEHRSATYQYEPERPILSGKSSESPKNKTYVGAPSSSRGEVRRSATYQPSLRVKHPSIRRSETMPVDRMRPGNPVPLKSSNLKNMEAPSDTTDSSSESEAQRSATYQPSPRVKRPSIRRSETMPVDRMRSGNPVPLKSSNLKNMKTPSDTTNSSSESEAQRSATYQPSPRVHHPSIRRSETMPIGRMRPGNPLPLKSSNLKNMKAPSDTTDSSSESYYDPPPRTEPSVRKPPSGTVQEAPRVSGAEESQPESKESHRASERPSTGPREGRTRSPEVDKRRPAFRPLESARDTPSQSRDSRRKEKLVAEYEHDTSEVYNAPFKFGDIWICPNTSSIQNETSSSRQPQGRSPEEIMWDLTYQFNFKYARQINDFMRGPFNAVEEREKNYRELTEAIRQHIVNIDSVNVEDDVLRGKQKRLIDDANRELRSLRARR